MTAVLETFRRQTNSPVKSEVSYNDRLAPSGILYQYTAAESRTASFKDNPQNLRERMHLINNPATIIERFMTINPKITDQRVLRVATMGNGDQMAVARPTSEYGRRDALVTMIPAGFADSEIPLDEDGDIVPHTWFSVDEKTRKVFSDTTMAILLDIHTKKGEKSKAMYMQNFADKLAPTTAQSQLPNHGHVVEMDLERVTPFPINDSIAQREANLRGISADEFREKYARSYTMRETLKVQPDDIKRIERETLLLEDREVTSFAAALLKRNVNRYFEANDLDIGTYTIGVRTAEPFGFTFAFNGAADAITQENALDPKNLERIFHIRNAIADAHPKMTHVLEKRAEGSNVLGERYGEEYSGDLSYPKQPSRQEIVDFDENGILRIHDVPMLSRLGPVEKTGPLLVRENKEEHIDRSDTTKEKDYARYAVVAHKQIEDYPHVVDIQTYEDAVAA